MKRRLLERHLRSHGCILLHHGARHDMWQNPSTASQSVIPRHNEVKLPTARAICKQLQVPPPAER